MLRIFGMLIGTLVLCMSSLQAQLPPVRLADIERYLNDDLKSFKAEFKQWDVNGAVTSGTLYLKRPGFIRMHYNSPTQFLILANGERIFFVNIYNNPPHQ